jgi:putative ABC transport system substrate-binding protein
MKRREFITLLGGTAATWPLVVRAQPPAMPVIGLLNNASPRSIAQRMPAFHQGLGETGYFEGKNVAIEYRWAEGRNDRLPVLAADLVRRRVAVIVALNNSSAQAAKAATPTIPIVFQLGNDPVTVGLVGNLNRPEANLTGVTTLSGELGAKRVELLHEMVPTATTIAAFINPTGTAYDLQAAQMEAACRTLGLNLSLLSASKDTDIDAGFGSLRERGAGGLVIANDGFLNSRIELFAALSLRHAVPTIFQFREFATAGGLMSYGSSSTDSYGIAGVYTGRILKGERPADLPVQQSTKIELILNLKTAKALDLTVPPSLLTRADEVIE